MAWQLQNEENRLGCDMMIYLLDCNELLANCCTDGGLIRVLNISKNIMDLIQLLAPIILILMASVHVAQLVINPDMKNGKKKLTNKVIAALLVFFVPTLLGAILNMLPDKYELGSCWKSARNIQNYEAEASYITISEGNRIKIEDFSSYSPPKIKIDDDDEDDDGSSSSVAGEGAKRLINVATGEIGNNAGNNSHAKYASYTGLSLSDPWCAAFVSWCANQAGFVDAKIIPKFTYCSTGLDLLRSMGAEIHTGSSGYTPQAGDIIFFDWGSGGDLDHVGIVTGADSNYVYTIEGNTSCSGVDCNGAHGVSKKTRPRDHTVKYYATPKY